MVADPSLPAAVPGASSPGTVVQVGPVVRGGKSRAVLSYVVTLSVAAVAITAAVLALQLPDVTWTSPHMVHVYAFAALLVITEQRPLLLARRDGDVDQITVSTTWAMALVICGPFALVLLAQGLSVALDDVLSRRGVLRTAFNVAQYVVTLTAARAAYCAVTGHSFLEVHGTFVVGDVPGALLAGLVFFVVNNGAVGLVMALDRGQSVVELLREDVRVQGLTSSILLGLAPVAVVVADFSVWMLPTLALPLHGVQTSARIAAGRQFEALHDGLTGLANRMLFHHRAERAVSAGRGTDTDVAVMLLDLDHFKEVNDTLGHHVGDDLLRQVAGRVAEGLPEGATLARLGGDEFAVLLPDAGDVEDVVGLARTLAARLREPVVADGVRIGVQASIGIAHHAASGTTLDALLRHADIALYHAKENRGEIQVYRPEIDQHTVQRLSLLGDLHTAVDSGQFHLQFQPQVDTATGEVVAVEALMRWDHPVHGLVAPETFVPLAEQSGVIAPLTRDAFVRALSTLAVLHAAGHRVAMAVNISARLLSDLELPRLVRGLVREHGVPAESVTIEVTESTITADPRRAMQILQELRATGMRVSVDDFGTGYSSLSYLRRLKPDELKVDRSFVMHMRDDENSAVIVRSTVDLGHGLGLSVVAEGVEDDATYGLLRDLGCDRVQGFLVARPMSLAALKLWLDTASVAGWRTAAARAAGLGAEVAPPPAVPPPVVRTSVERTPRRLPVTKPLPVGELALDAAP